jgi:hypothetical protein
LDELQEKMGRCFIELIRNTAPKLVGDYWSDYAVAKPTYSEPDGGQICLCPLVH